MESALIGTILKYLGLGGGGIGIIMIVAFLWMHIRVKNNAKEIEQIKPKCDEHNNHLQKHEILLTEICTKQDTMIDTQSAMFKKIDKLIELHMKE